MDNQQTDETKASQSKTKAGTVIFRIVVVALLCVLIILQLTQRCSQQDGELHGIGAAAARFGQLEGKTEEEIQAELDRVIEEGMFRVSINIDPVFANGTASGTLEIENVPNNLYLMRVLLYRDDTGELIYDSNMIEPNYHIQRDTLLVDLDAGDWPATAIFYAYDRETYEEVGSVVSRVTIHVLN